MNANLAYVMLTPFHTFASISDLNLKVNGEKNDHEMYFHGMWLHIRAGSKVNPYK